MNAETAAILGVMTGVGLCLLISYCCCRGEKSGGIVPVSLPEIKPDHKNELSINKPVLEFVQCFMESPRDFKLVHRAFDMYSSAYDLIDSGRDHKFSICIFRTYCDFHLAISEGSIDIDLNKAEQDYLYDSISGYYKDRAARLKSLKQNRIRNRLAKSYS